jgi:hypothetical protein
VSDQTTVLWVSQPNLGRDVSPANWPIVRVTQVNGNQPVTVTLANDNDAAVNS